VVDGGSHDQTTALVEREIGRGTIFGPHVDLAADIEQILSKDCPDEKSTVTRSRHLKTAFGHAQYHDCGDCWAAYLNERKALFGLKPAVLRELFRRG
jgi:hypothetical protein